MARPYGYATDRVTVVEREADALRQAADRILSGASLRSTVGWLNESGYRTSEGGQWQANTLRRVLLSPRVAGYAEQEGALIEANWPAVLHRTDWEKLVALFNDESRRPAFSSQVRTYLLTGGLAVCGACSAILVSRPTKRGRGYICRSGPPTNGCGTIRVQAEALEEFVSDRVLARLALPDYRAFLLSWGAEKAASAAETVRSSEQRIKDLAWDYSDGKVPRAAYTAATRALQTRIADAREEGRRADNVYLVAPLTSPKALVEWWNSASLDQRRTVAGLVLREVQVRPAPIRGAKVFQPERVHIVWHQES